MHEDWIPLLRCPETGSPFDVDAVRRAGPEIVEAFLVARGGRALRVVLAGIGVLPPALAPHLRAHGPVYARVPIADSRVARLVLGGLGTTSDDFVPFDEVIGRYGDLVPASVVPEPVAPDPRDETLASLLAALGRGGGRGLDLGCGVGRSTFVLRTHVDAAFGVDRSLARVRRARNVSVTQADFFLPAPVGADAKEVPLELDRLAREGVDFAVCDVASLPFVDGAFDVVVVRDGDGRGPWPDVSVATAEASRVLSARGTWITATGEGPPGFESVARAGAWSAWRRP